MFSKRHYEFIAAILRERIEGEDDYLRVVIVARFADALTKDNPRFDRERFIDACKI